MAPLWSAARSSHTRVLRLENLTVLVDPVTANPRKDRWPYFYGLRAPRGDYRVWAELLRRSMSSSVSISITIGVVGTPPKRNASGSDLARSTVCMDSDEYGREDTACADRYPNVSVGASPTSA